MDELELFLTAQVPPAATIVSEQIIECVSLQGPVIRALRGRADAGRK